MNQQVVCKSKEYQLHLDCEKVERNLYKVLNLISKIDMLYTISDNPIKKAPQAPQKYPPPPPPKRRRSKQTKLKEAILKRKDIRYSLNNKQSQQLIWRSAYLAKELGIANEQIRGLYSDRLVGEKNDLDEIILTLAKKLKSARQNEENSTQLKDAKAKLIRLGQIRNQVEKIWANLEYEKPNESRLLYSPPLTLFNEQMYDEEKRRIATYIKKYLVSLDLRILQHSIMFIQELQTGHCIVTLEQSYPSFMVFKELFKRVIGPHHYYRGLRQLLLAKQQCYKKGLMFRVSRFRMCHLCEVIDYQQEEGYQCHIRERLESIIETPYGYQQIILFSNYAYVNQYEVEKIQRKSLANKSTKFLNRKFITYKHPYSQIFKENCNRYYCFTCKKADQKEEKTNEEKMQLKKGQAFSSTITSKIKELECCSFCRLQCQCQRCSTMTTFNRLMALYQSIGGNFEDLLNDLVFLNLQSQEIFLQYIDFQNNEGQYQFEQGTKIDINQADLDSLPLADQIARLQQMLLNADEMQEEDSIDSNQIFPNIQKMFSELIVHQVSSNEPQEEEMRQENNDEVLVKKQAE